MRRSGGSNPDRRKGKERGRRRRAQVAGHTTPKGGLPGCKNEQRGDAVFDKSRRRLPEHLRDCFARGGSE